MRTPEQIAAEIVDRFSWSSNVMLDGRLVGQQYVVAQAITEAIRAERRRTTIAHEALGDTALALNGVNTGYLRPAGHKARRAIRHANIALRLLTEAPASAGGRS